MFYVSAEMGRDVIRSVLTIAAVVLAMGAAGCGGAEPSALRMPPGALSLAVAPDFAGTLWAPTAAGDFRSQDGGHTWKRVHGHPSGRAIAFTERWAYLPGSHGAQIADFGGSRLSPPRPTPVSFVAVASPYHRTNRLYALDDHGRLWLSVNAGVGWSELRGQGLPPALVAIGAVRGPITRPDTIYVCAGDGGLWRSVDFGATFTKLAGAPAARAVALTTDDQRLVLVATGDGLLLSRDHGKTFERVSSIPATAVAFDPRNHSLAYASVDGRLLRSVDGARSWPF
jgi:photosystem II stability/assembly factor-like uncharacterized protein